MIFNEVSLRNGAVTAELMDRFDEMVQPFIISIDLKDDFRPGQIAALLKYVRNKMKEVKGNSIFFPFSLVYPEENPKITLDFVNQVSKGEKGHIRGINYEGGIKGDWTDVRRKIAAGISQLHPDYPGVIIARP
jgi:hypothetical protein